MPHIHDKIDFTVETFVVHRDRVLLRFHDKYNIWLSVGGHIELDEDPNEAAVREVKEEVGLDIKLVGEIADTEEKAPYKELLSPRYLNRHHITETHEHVTFIYFATSESDVVQPSGHDQSATWQWFSLDDIADPKYGILPSIQFYATQALKELGKK